MRVCGLGSKFYLYSRTSSQAPSRSVRSTSAQTAALRCPALAAKRWNCNPTYSFQRRSQVHMGARNHIMSRVSMDTASSSVGLIVDIKDDNEDTVITVRGEDQESLLVTITGVLDSLDLTIVSAAINSDDENNVYDEFHVTTRDGSKVPSERWENIKLTLSAMAGSSSKSSLPAIYGMVAAAEVKRLRPLSQRASSKDSAALELAAAEMAQAAANLVSLERALAQSEENGGGNVSELEMQCAEAAAMLERQMAAMEAVLAARRAKVTASEPTHEMQREEGADLRFAQGGGTGTGPAAGNGFEIILQGFNWESHKQDWYKVLAGQVKVIADSGITSVWFPPPSDSVSPQGYLPRDLYDLNSQYGTEAELRDCISIFHEHNLKVVADIVINHRCAHYQGHLGKWNKFGGRLAWDHTAICSNNPDFAGAGGRKQGEDYVAAPNIDHTQERIRKDIVEWLKYLKKVGFDGWRFDFVKGYSGEYARIYVDNTVPALAFGEYWDTCSYQDGVLSYNQDSHRQRTVNWIDATGGTSAAFDFTTKGILQEAVGRREYWRLIDNQGRPPGVLGLWPSRAITFIENHDTGSTLNHWPFPNNHLHEGYAYIITHPGTPCIFYDHFWSKDRGLGESVRELIKIRQRNRINCRSAVTINKASGELYAATIDNRVAMKIGWGDWTPNQDKANNGKQWKLAASGPNFAVWETN